MNFEEVFTTIFQHPIVRAVLVLVLVNLLVGIAAGLKTGTFHMDQIADFLRTMVVPYVGGGLLMQLLLWGVAGEYFPPQIAQITGSGVWLAVIAALLWRCIRHLKALGVPGIPDGIEPAVNQDTSTTAVTGTGDGRKKGDEQPIRP